MARKILTEQEKTKKKKKRIIIIIILAIVLIVGGIFIFKHFSQETSSTAIEVKVLDSIEEYGYTLSDKDSKLYKDEYEKLKDILLADKIDEKEYATQVAKMFVIDLYSLSTKMNKYDIGGNEFFFADKKKMYETKVMDTIYSTLQDDTYGDRKQELPLVTSVNVESVEETKYTLNNNKIDAYLIKLTWEYEKDLQYDNKASIVIAQEEGMRFSVVDYQPTLEPNYDKR